MSEPLNLSTVRETVGISRSELAERLGLSPASGRVTVAQMEQREDWLLSRIGAYVAALGGTAELVVRVAGEELRFDV